MSSKQEDKRKLRPPPHHFTVQFPPQDPQTWSVVTPSVYRYENSCWINEFFESGKLRLSTFAKFATYADENRGDPDEGTAVCYGQTTGNAAVMMTQSQGMNAAILCCSHKLDHNLRQQFDRDNAFEILNTFGFAVAVARQLLGFRRGMEGSCIYRADTSINRAIDLDFERYKIDDRKIDMRMISDAGSALGGPELLLLKRKSYERQQEYRLLWELDVSIKDFVDVIAPEAIQFCRRIGTEEWGK